MDSPRHDGAEHHAVAAASSRGRREDVIAWTFVAVQFLLIGLVVLLPRGDAWSLPAWFSLAATVGTWTGIGLMAFAAAALRRGLTAAPLPNAHARLRTSGLYRYVRHPIYTGLLLFTASQVVSSRSVPASAAGIGLLLLINVKARWEEQRLEDRFEEYSDYARATPRFVLGWPRRRA